MQSCWPSGSRVGSFSFVQKAACFMVCFLSSQWYRALTHNSATLSVIRDYLVQELRSRASRLPRARLSCGYRDYPHPPSPGAEAKVLGIQECKRISLFFTGVSFFTYRGLYGISFNISFLKICFNGKFQRMIYYLELIYWGFVILCRYFSLRCACILPFLNTHISCGGKPLK